MTNWDEPASRPGHRCINRVERVADGWFGASSPREEGKQLYNHTVWLAVCALTLGLTIGTAHAITLQQKREALKEIGDFADRLCDHIPIEGSGQNVELSGNARAELSKLASTLADLGIEGAGKYQKSQYEGLLQKDLATELENSRDCKREIFRELKQEFFKEDGGPESSARPTQQPALKQPSTPMASSPQKPPETTHYTFDGVYYSPEWKYGFRINGNRGIATISNSPTYTPGDVILRFTVTGSQTFTGEHICTDGHFYPVTGELFRDGALEMSMRGCSSRPWRMVRAETAYDSPAITNAPMTDRNKYFITIFNSAIEMGNRLNINITIQNVYGAPLKLSAPFQLVQRGRSATDAGIANDNSGNIFALQNVIGLAAGRCQRVRFSNEYNVITDGATQTVIFDFAGQSVQNKGTSLSFSTNLCVETADDVGSVSIGFSNAPLR